MKTTTRLLSDNLEKLKRKGKVDDAFLKEKLSEHFHVYNGAYRYLEEPRKASMKPAMLDVTQCLSMYEASGDKKYYFEAGLAYYEMGRYPDAIRIFRDSTPYSWYHLGLCHEMGYGTKKDLQKAAECYKNAVYQENEDALLRLKKLYYRNSLKYDYELSNLLSNRRIHLNDPDKEYLLHTYEKNHYLTEMMIENHICGSFHLKSAREFLKWYGIDIYKDLMRPTATPDEWILYLLDILDKHRDLLRPNLVEYFGLDASTVEFLKDDSDECRHTAAEASLYFDIPMAEARKRYLQLMMYERCPDAQSDVKLMVYTFIHHPSRWYNLVFELNGKYLKR